MAPQMPHNPTEATSQTERIRNRVQNHQESSQTHTSSVIDQFAKGAMAIMHENATLRAEVRILREANTSLAKRHRVKITHISQGSTLLIDEGQYILDQRDVDTQLREETLASSCRARRVSIRSKIYSNKPPSVVARLVVDLPSNYFHPSMLASIPSQLLFVAAFFRCSFRPLRFCL